MGRLLAAALVVTTGLTGATTALAESNEPRVHRQSAPVNIKIVVLERDGSAGGAIIDQTGRYNSAAIVSRRGGGYGAIYQTGGTNRAFGGLVGSGSRTVIDQVQIEVPHAYKPRWARGWRRR